MKRFYYSCMCGRFSLPWTICPHCNERVINKEYDDKINEFITKLYKRKEDDSCSCQEIGGINFTLYYAKAKNFRL